MTLSDGFRKRPIRFTVPPLLIAIAVVAALAAARVVPTEGRPKSNAGRDAPLSRQMETAARLQGSRVAFYHQQPSLDYYRRHELDAIQIDFAFDAQREHIGAAQSPQSGPVGEIVHAKFWDTSCKTGWRSSNGEARVEEADYAQLVKLPGLKSIDVDWAPLSDGALFYIGHVTSLKEARLNWTWSELPGITDAGLANLTKLHQLERLIISAPSSKATPPIRDAGLAHLAKLSSLEELTLVRTGVAGPGLAQLSRLSHLRKLVIIAAPLDDEGLRHLALCRGLRELTLSQTQITPRGAAWIQSQLPQCVVTYKN
jgi:hypothetical protein